MNEEVRKKCGIKSQQYFTTIPSMRVLGDSGSAAGQVPAINYQNCGNKYFPDDDQDYRVFGASLYRMLRKESERF